MSTIEQLWKEFVSEDGKRARELTPLGWFAAGYATAEVQAPDLREAVRAALEVHYEGDDHDPGAFNPDCVVCEVRRAAFERRRQIEETAAAERRRIQIEAYQASEHVYRDLKEPPSERPPIVPQQPFPRGYA